MGKNRYKSLLLKTIYKKLSFAKIGAELGISKEAARKGYHRAQKEKNIEEELIRLVKQAITGFLGNKLLLGRQSYS